MTKQTWKKILVPVAAVILAAVLVFVLMQINRGIAPAPAPAAVEVPAAPAAQGETAAFDLNAVVARVNGQDILAKDMIEEVEANKIGYAMYMSSYGQAVDTADEEFQRYVIEGVLKQRTERMALTAKAEALGIAETPAEELATIQQGVDEGYQAAYDACMQDIKAQSPDATEEQLVALTEAELLKYGYTKQALLENETFASMNLRLMAEATKDVTMTEEEARTAYTEMVAQAKTQYLADKDAYISDLLNGAEIVYHPPGYRTVRHILLMAATPEEMPQMVEKGNQILAEIQGGKDFEAAVTEYGQDPGMGDPLIKDGYPLCEGSQSYDEQFTTAAMALANVGDLSPVVESSFGVHIIKYVGDVAEGEVPFEQNKDDFMTHQLEQRKNTAYETAKAEWITAANIEMMPDAMIIKQPAPEPLAINTRFAQVSAEQTQLRDKPNGTALAELKKGVPMSIEGEVTVNNQQWGFVTLGTEPSTYGYVLMGDVKITEQDGALSADAVIKQTVDATGKKPVFTIVMNDGTLLYGELYPETAPISVGNFISLANSNFYNGTIFHRVIPGFMIQGGDPDGSGTGGPGYAIKGEFSANGVDNAVKHTRGVLSMARSAQNDSAGSQFFVCVADAANLDTQYAAFGMVEGGMETADAIVSTPTDGSDKPNRVIQQMKMVYVETYGVEYPFEKIAE